jgi:ribosomal protein S24E
MTETKITNFNETENALFNRREIEAVVETGASVSNDEAAKLVSEKTSVPVEHIRVNQVKSGFGKSEFKILADVYGSKEDKDKYVKKTKQEIEAEKKAAEEAVKAEAEAKPEEAPVENSEEKPTEEKPAEEKTEETKEEKAEEAKE